MVDVLVVVNLLITLRWLGDRTVFQTASLAWGTQAEAFARLLDGRWVSGCGLG